jgi:hypothetical protein
MVASTEEVRPGLRRHDWHRDSWHLPALGVAPARFADRFPLAGDQTSPAPTWRREHCPVLVAIDTAHNGSQHAPHYCWVIP